MWTRAGTSDKAARAVADGRDIDWDSLDDQAGEHERALLHEFRRLAKPLTQDAPGRSAGGIGTSARWATLVVACLATAQVLVGITAIFAAWVATGRLTLPGPQYLITVVVFMFAGGVLLTGGRHSPHAVALGAFFAVVASAFAMPLVTSAASAIRAPTWASGWAAFAADAFLPAVLLSFVSQFPRSRGFVQPQELSRGLCTAAWFLGVILFAANSLLVMFPTATPPFLALLDRRRPLQGVYWTVLLAFVLCALGLAFWKSCHTLGDDRGRARWLLLGVAIGSGPMVVASLLTAGGSPFRAWVISHRAGIGYVIYSFLLTIPASAAYFVSARRVLEVRPKIVAYTLTRVLIATVSSVCPFVVAVWAYVRRNETITGVVSDSQFIPLVAMALAALALAASQWRLAAALRYWFFRERPDLGSTLSTLAALGAEGSENRDVTRRTADEINNALHPVGVDFFVWNTAFGGYVPVASGDGRGLPGSSGIAMIAADIDEPLVIDLEAPHSFARLLPEQDQQWVMDTGCTLIVPVKGTRGLPVALAALGPKCSHLAYSAADRRFLRGLMTAMASQIERHLNRVNRPRGSADSSIRLADESAFECDQCGVITECGDICVCGGHLEPAPVPLLLSGKFRIERRIGRGGMGVVYRAQDLALDRIVAIKTLPRLSTAASLRLQREARTMATVVHPNLAVLLGLETWRGVPLLVMEYLHGGSLAAGLRRARLTPSRAVDLGLAIADGLGCMHRVGLVHGDVKPSNIAYQHDDVPKLLDFGLAQILTAASRHGEHWKEVPREILGTPAYLPPEALTQEMAHPGWDLWGLALVLYEAVTGVNPLLGDDVSSTMQRVREGRLPDIREQLPTCPDQLATFLQRALSVDPNRRPSSGAAFKSALAATRSSLFR